MSETLTRSLLATYWLNEWVGPAQTDKTWCAAAVQGVDFDPDSDADCAPFSALEVRGDESAIPPVPGKGYVRMSLDELDRDGPQVTSGIDPNPPYNGAMVTTDWVLWRLQFAIRIPDGHSLTIRDEYREELVRLFTGLTIRHEGPPSLTLRTLSKYPPRRRGDFVDGSWHLSFLDVRVQAKERRPHVGVQEVSP